MAAHSWVDRKVGIGAPATKAFLWHRIQETHMMIVAIFGYIRLELEVKFLKCGDNEKSQKLLEKT